MSYIVNGIISIIYLSMAYLAYTLFEQSDKNTLAFICLFIIIMMAIMTAEVSRRFDLLAFLRVHSKKQKFMRSFGGLYFVSESFIQEMLEKDKSSMVNHVLKSRNVITDFDLKELKNLSIKELVQNIPSFFKSESGVAYAKVDDVYVLNSSAWFLFSLCLK